MAQWYYKLFYTRRYGCVHIYKHWLMTQIVKYFQERLTYCSYILIRKTRSILAYKSFIHFTREMKITNDTLWMVNFGCKCLNPSKGAREQLVTNLRSKHRSLGSNPANTYDAKWLNLMIRASLYNRPKKFMPWTISCRL